MREKKKTNEYILTMRCDGATECAIINCTPTSMGDYSDWIAEIKNEVRQTCRDWIDGGDYPDEGALVYVYYSVEDNEGEEILAGMVEVEVEPDHNALIRAARLSPYLDDCGDDPDDHDWTSEGEGGCDENPGVWSLGGTTLSFNDHCSVCGLRRKRLCYGIQRNPGQIDTVTYMWED